MQPPHDRRSPLVAAATGARRPAAVAATAPRRPPPRRRRSAASREHRRCATLRRATPGGRMVAMTDPATGLPADNIDGVLDAATRSGYTSPTNIGAYLWSTVVARDLGLIIQRRGARGGSAQTLSTLRELEHHEPSGMFYNWYDPATGAKLHDLARERQHGRTPFLSSVDNGWLAAALLVVSRADAAAARTQADALLQPDGLRLLLQRRREHRRRRRPDPRRLLGRGRRPTRLPSRATTAARGPDVWYTCHHYGAFNTEPRIASLPRHRRRPDPGEALLRHRAAPSRRHCDWSLARDASRSASGPTYLGIDVFEGALPYRGMRRRARPGAAACSRR